MSRSRKRIAAGGRRARGGDHGHAHDHEPSHAHDDHGHTHSHDDHAHEHTHDSAHDGHTHSHDDHVHDHHTHSHTHAHPHSHAHPSPRARDRRPDLRAGAGRGKVLFFDAPSGLAGDMIIAALVDLGVPEDVVTRAVDGLSLKGAHVHFGIRERSGIVATSFEVHEGGPSPERTYGSIRGLLDRAKLSEGVRARAHATFRRLAEAEAKVHAMPIDDVHFHEVGAVDAIVDVVGSAAALEHLGARLVVSPLPMGHGWVKARHGILPLPPPAVVDALRGLSTYDGKLAFEFVTPTGAAIVGAHAESSSRWPSMMPERSGWGAGTAVLADRPNVLRAVLGAPAEDAAPAGATHVVVEANVDDATGELLGHCIEALLAEGALDAWAVPLTMKKGRPAFQIAALATASHADAIAAAMLRESTTIGVRRYDVARVERPRRTAIVDTPFGALPVKIAEGPFGPPSRKPEFDASLAAARAHGVPVRVVLQAVTEAAARSTSETATAPRASTRPGRTKAPTLPDVDVLPSASKAIPSKTASAKAGRSSSGAPKVRRPGPKGKGTTAKRSARGR